MKDYKRSQSAKRVLFHNIKEVTENNIKINSSVH
jgi:hypothetical protein